MVAELKNYQSQVNAYRFEIERLDRQIVDVKQMYFTQKRQGKLGVIQEEQEEMPMGGGMDGGVM
jgi:glucan biosynthesis protein